MRTNRFIVMVITFIILAMSTTGAFASSYPSFTSKTSKVKDKYVTKFYVNNHYTHSKVTTTKKLKVKVVDASKVTRKTITHRRNNYILVVKVKGRCIDNNGNGITSTGEYINYQDCENAVKGQRFISYCIYNNSNSTKTIARIDTWK